MADQPATPEPLNLELLLPFPYLPNLRNIANEAVDIGNVPQLSDLSSLESSTEIKQVAIVRYGPCIMSDERAPSVGTVAARLAMVGFPLPRARKPENIRCIRRRQEGDKAWT